MPLDLRHFRGSDCITDQCLVLEEVVDCQSVKKFHIERFKLTKLTKIEVRKQYQFKIYEQDQDGPARKLSTNLYDIYHC
jgi:hypothetical protein